MGGILPVRRVGAMTVPSLDGTTFPRLLDAAFQWSPVIGGIVRLIALAVTWVAATAGFGAAILSRGGTHRGRGSRHRSRLWRRPT